MRRIFLLALLVITACGSSPHAAPPVLTKASGVLCADLVATAMVSQHAVVSGVEACLDQTAANKLANWTPPITSDRGFEDYARLEPVFTQARYANTASDPMDGSDVIVYRLTNPHPSGTHSAAMCLGLFMAGSKPTSGPDNRQVDYVAFKAANSGLC